ncbi:hypothetical protein CHARACLAT_007904 [Characodon lateralis]|uniref:Uncharacterized protein n=1 Tax=Characodon lateralis TaxID=208331 RepID=A0ABU7E7Y2_9TELE|nr:hypothetical protein [Characodon lateralis]
MGNWYSNKEFVSARAECQLVKDGVQSWEAVGLPVDETASPPTRSRCGRLLGRLCEKKAVRADCFLSAERTSRAPRSLCWVNRRLRTGPASTSLSGSICGDTKTRRRRRSFNAESTVYPAVLSGRDPISPGFHV